MQFLQGKLSLNKLTKYLFLANKKGHTLLELVIAINIALILLTLINYEISMESKAYNDTLIETSQHFYVTEAFRYIDSELKDNVKKVEVVENTLIMAKYNNRPAGETSLIYSGIDFIGVKITCIKLIGDELQISYDTSFIPVVLLKDVELFQVDKCENKLFLSIKMKKGSLIKKCFNLNVIEN